MRNNKDCKICEGKGSYLASDPVYECLVVEECLDCSNWEAWLGNLEQETTKMLREISPVRLAMYLSEFLVWSIDANENDKNGIDRLDEILVNKNKTGLRLMLEGYIKAISEKNYTGA